MTATLRVNGRLAIPEAELKWRFSRSSGPGGQSVNTADSRVELSFDVANSPSLGATYRRRALERLESRLVDGVVTISAQTERSQLRNREVARQRLAEMLAAAVAPPPPARRATKATKASQQRRLDRKRKHGNTKRLRRAPGTDS